METKGSTLSRATRFITARFFGAARWSSVVFGCGVSLMAASASSSSVIALKQLSLEELMNVPVTSVSRIAEPYRDAAAALTVLTQEHIRRSGATNIPEALRGVPGLHVARQTANSWAISSRGFSSANSEKLLVQMDTRSIYTPLFSGVFWDVQDYIMADIDRIEVIRGPGAALWGANAVNGIINIITKPASDTQGTHIKASAGTDEMLFAIRHGARAGGAGHFRVFAKYLEREASSHTSSSDDDWRLGHVGFRGDWTPDTGDGFTLQGDVYAGEIGRLAPSVTIIGRPGPTGDLETRVSGGNVLGRWRRTFTADSDLEFRAYYDRTHRNDPSFNDDLDTIDLELQHRFSPRARHDVVWGLNYRYLSNRNEGKGIFALQPPSSEDHLFSAFVQDQIALQDNFRVTVGTKLEHNDFSGFEIQPSLRAAWDITPKHTLWAAVSRAVRTPTRLERDISIDVTNPAVSPVARLVGNSEFRAEELLAAELGYRWRPSSVLLFDLALFENRYDGLASLELGAPFSDTTTPRTIIPILNRNLTEGRARGFEAVVTHNPLPQWRLSASYSHLDLSIDPAGQDINRGRFYEGATPRHQFAVSSYLTLLGRFELDAHFRHLSEIRRLPADPSGAGIPAYSEVDISLTWHASLNARFSIVGQNLLHDEHVEFGTPGARGAVKRGVYVKAVFDF